jgi:hypothetical protein
VRDRTPSTKKGCHPKEFSCREEHTYFELQVDIATEEFFLGTHPDTSTKDLACFEEILSPYLESCELEPELSECELFVRDNRDRRFINV